MIRTFLNFQVQHNIAYKSHKTAQFESIYQCPNCPQFSTQHRLRIIHTKSPQSQFWKYPYIDPNQSQFPSSTLHVIPRCPFWKYTSMSKPSMILKPNATHRSHIIHMYIPHSPFWKEVRCEPLAISWLSIRRNSHIKNI